MKFAIGDKVVVDTFEYAGTEDYDLIMDFITENEFPYFVITNIVGETTYPYELCCRNNYRTIFFGENEIMLYDKAKARNDMEV